MRNSKNKLHSSGKNTSNIDSRRYKSFGYQVLGFGAGGGKSFMEASGGTVRKTVILKFTHLLEQVLL